MNQTPTEKSQYKKNRNRSVIYIFKKVGLMNQTRTWESIYKNQAPTQKESKPGIRQIKTVQFIDTFEKVGLMNQTPTWESIYKNQAHKKKLNPYSLLIYLKGGFDESNPYRRIPTEEESNSYKNPYII